SAKATGADGVRPGPAPPPRRATPAPARGPVTAPSRPCPTPARGHRVTPAKGGAPGGPGCDRPCVQTSGFGVGFKLVSRGTALTLQLCHASARRPADPVWG